MARKSIDPVLPEIRLELLEDLSPAAPPGFLRLVRRRLAALYPDGSRSADFVYDEVDRHAIDAVVLVAHYRTLAGENWVYLRSALRPPVVFRDPERSPIPSLDPRGSIWELPAGLIEVEDQSPEGVARSALRELMEELGFAAERRALYELGPSTFPAPGLVAERHFYFSVEVDPTQRGEPELDGSALEREGAVLALPLAQALAMCRDGGVIDAKTELGLRRLEERLARASGGTGADYA